MPEYLAPGVYIEEVATGPVPIEGVSTSTSGMVGQTERGPTAVTLVTSFTQYQRWFGGLIDVGVSFLPFAAQGFFANGGQRLFIARVVGVGALPAAAPIGGGNLTLTAIGPGNWGNHLFFRIQASSLQKKDVTGASSPVGFRITIIYYATLPPLPLVDPFDTSALTDPARRPNRRDPDAVEDYDNLRIDSNDPEYVLTAINGSSQLIQVALTNSANPVTIPAAAPFTQMTGGAEPAAATETEYIGTVSLTKSPDQRLGLAALDTIDEISLLSVPDEVRFPNVTPEIITQCERRKDRFAVMQVAEGKGLVQNIRPPEDTSYAAFYAPWIRVFNPTNGDYPLVPPGGHIMGIYANTDVERGVHKAPANYEIAGMVIRDIDSTRKPLEFAFTKGEQDILNPRGVNAIMDFRSHGRGIRVWGARTMSTDGQWRYINVRRLFIFVEQSIDRGTQWVVFEPNDDTTWARVKRSLSNFLTSVWRSGALMGTTAEEAFFVKCDRTTMTQDDIDNGRLICLVGIAPVKPAEFVIFRFSQKTIEAQQ